MRDFTTGEIARSMPLESERGSYTNGTSTRHLDLGWARSYGSRAERLGLRRGAWYRVVEHRSKPWVVLDVNHIEVRVPRTYLQFRGESPSAWCVVEPASAGIEDSPARLVCPACHARFQLWRGITELCCPACGKVSPVDWDDPG